MSNGQANDLLLDKLINLKDWVERHPTLPNARCYRALALLEEAWSSLEKRKHERKKA